MVIFCDILSAKTGRGENTIFNIHPLISAYCPYSGQDLPSGAVRARSGRCSGAGKRRPVGRPLQPGGSGSDHLFFGKLRSGRPAQARSPDGVVTALELPLNSKLISQLLSRCIYANLPTFG